MKNLAAFLYIQAALAGAAIVVAGSTMVIADAALGIWPPAAESPLSSPLILMAVAPITACYAIGALRAGIWLASQFTTGRPHHGPG